MTQSATASMVTIDSFLRDVGSVEKRAAEANTEAGSIGGETEHPVKNVDDRTEVAQEGARSAENNADVKEDQGKVGVNSTPEASAKAANDLSRFAKPMSKLLKRAEEATGGAVQTPGSASDDQLQIGTKKEPTGEDPSNETGSAKAGKEDPGSTHPARTDNDSLDGNKYAADIASYSKMSSEKLAELLEKVGNDLVASIAEDLGSPAQQQPAQRQKQASAQAPTPNLSHQAGWELAGLVGGQQIDKAAADAMVQHKIGEIIKTASSDADNVVTYILNYRKAMTKRAAGDPAMGGDPMAAMGGGGGDPMAAMAGGGGAGGGDPMAAMGGGGGMDGGGGGADQAMLDSLGGGGGGDPAADPELAELAQTLQQLQISPGELNEALLADASGGGAGGDPSGGAGGDPSGGGAGAAAGGAPPPGGGAGGGAGGPGEAGGDPSMETQASDKKKGGQDKSAAVKQGNNQLGVREYLQELVERSRRK